MKRATLIEVSDEWPLSEQLDACLHNAAVCQRRAAFWTGAACALGAAFILSAIATGLGW